MDFMDELRTCSGIRENFEPVDKTETLTSSSTELDSSAGESKAARSWISWMSYAPVAEFVRISNRSIERKLSRVPLRVRSAIEG